MPPRSSSKAVAANHSLRIPAAAAGNFALSGIHPKTTPVTSVRYSSPSVQVVQYSPGAAPAQYPCYPCYTVMPTKSVTAMSVGLPPSQLPRDGTYIRDFFASGNPPYPLNFAPHVTSPRQPPVQWQSPDQNFQPVATATPNCIQQLPPLMPHCNYTATGCGQVVQQIVPIPTAVIRHSSAIGGAHVTTHGGSDWYEIEAPAGRARPLMPLDLRLLDGVQPSVTTASPCQHLGERQQLVDLVRRLHLTRNVSFTSGSSGQPSLPWAIAGSSHSTTARAAMVVTPGGPERNVLDQDNVMGDEKRVASTAAPGEGARWDPVTATEGGARINHVSDWSPLIHPSDLRQVWHEAFEKYFLKFCPDSWQLEPVADSCDANMLEATCQHFQDSAKVRFICEQCGKAWTSMKGRVSFYVTDRCAGSCGIRGTVYFKLFGQICQKCRNGSFLSPLWYPEEVLKVVYNVFYFVGTLHYQFPKQTRMTERRKGKPRTEHQKELCQACAEGICREALAFSKVLTSSVS